MSSYTYPERNSISDHLVIMRLTLPFIILSAIQKEIILFFFTLVNQSTAITRLNTPTIIGDLRFILQAYDDFAHILIM